MARDISWWLTMHKGGSIKDNDRIDIIYRNVMLVSGIITSSLFILSLIATIEFPSAFKYLALSMLVSAGIFLVIRSIYNYRRTFKVHSKK